MYISKAIRTAAYLKYNKRCAYSGSILLPDWQLDHIVPVIRDEKQRYSFPQFHHFSNLVPCQRQINHMKGAYDLEYFRTVRLGQLHRKLRHLPEYPTTKKALKDKEYHQAIAKYFGITPDKPFSGVFFFEKVRKSTVYRNERHGKKFEEADERKTTTQEKRITQQHNSTTEQRRQQNNTIVPQHTNESPEGLI